jgi:hypothetical protein
MKNMKNLLRRRTLRALIIGLAAATLASYPAKASPYASGVTNDSGTIRFVMNEAGADVTVIFEDATTFAMGVLPKGATNFALGSHSSYQIKCTKVGNGTPALISSDTFSNSIWANPRGVAANQNPKIGHLFGRIYAGSGGTGGYGPGTPGYKAQGIYAMNADQTTALGKGTNAYGTATFANSGTSGPWRMRVAPDNTLLVDDFSTTGAALWQFQPDLSDSNLVLSIIGQTAAAAAGIHGDFFGTPLMTGSLAAGNLVLWTADSGMGVPAGTTTGPGTSVGSYNCVFRYDIGSGPLPWNQKPNYAYTVGLDGIAELRPEVDIGKDGKIIAGFGRANLSNPDIQILSPDGTTLLYTSGNYPPANLPPPSDPWNGISGSGSQGGMYAGVRVSPDGRYLASVDINNGITIASLVNGLPDDSSIFGIVNTPATGNSRGMDWDAANNLYVISSGQGLLRIYSLGITTTCITSNDLTGTNGGFQMIVPSVTATVVATQPYASQNYINNSAPGAPIPGVFKISLGTNHLDGPVTVNFTRTGTASYNAANLALSTYTINTNETPNGVIIGTNTVTFPAGNMPGGGNWYVDVKITPTAFPVSTNTLTMIMTISGGSTYLAGSPSRDTVFIQNTGPQLLLLTAVANTTTVFGGATMYRGVTNDYAKFVITRLGDTNGPGNSPGNVSQTAYTITNVTYVSNATTAVFGRDYTARAQRIDPLADGKIQPPVDGPTAIVIYPGDTAVTCCVGNPVAHTNLSLTPTNLSIIVNMTNAVTGITNTSAEGNQYTVGTATVTLTELDNAVGPEAVLWSNPLTNAADSVNWTLTFAATNFGYGGLPVVVPNYVNDATSIAGGGTNDFLARFGNPVASDGVIPSPVMAANGWTSALKMTVNKANSAQAGVNVYPQGQKFNGNYALRFNMYLSLYDFAINNPNIASAGREYALFGVNHIGNNCNWRTDAALAVGAGMFPTNSDGQWFAIDAGSGGITPADFDAMTPGPLPNNANSGGVGGLNDKASNTAVSQNGVFKHPPFDCMNTTDFTRTIGAPGGGEPANKWVDVSVEITRQTNINVFINNSLVIPTFALTNGLGLAASYTNGTIMLGYDDPNANISDSSAFVYFSNVRVVELSPYIVVQPGLTNSLASNLIVTQGASLILTSAVSFGSAPITNVWYRGTAVAAGTGTGATPTAALQTNSVNAISMTDSLTRTFTGAIDATNYMSVFSDAAGSVTSAVVAVEVVLTPANVEGIVGSLAQLQVRAVGPSAPTSYQWQTNGVNLANSAHYAGVTSTNLFITNAQPADAMAYSVIVGQPGGTVTQTVVLTMGSTVGPVTPASQTNLVGTTASFTVSATGSGPFTYRWKQNGVNLGNVGNISGSTNSILTITNVATTNAGSYTVGVTNGAGGLVAGPGVLTVILPTLSSVSLVGPNVVLSYYSPNSLSDTTNAYNLQSAGVVTGPYTNTPAAYSISGGIVQITVPQTAGNMFYRLVH